VQRHVDETVDISGSARRPDQAENAHGSDPVCRRPMAPFGRTIKAESNGLNFNQLVRTPPPLMRHAGSRFSSPMPGPISPARYYMPRSSGHNVIQRVAVRARAQALRLARNQTR